jgi:polyisoprenoid-binding protein YceI
VSKVRVVALDQPRSLRLLPITAFALGAALVLGTAGAYAQEAEPPAEAADGIDGTWVVDTDIGDFTDFSSSWVGFRVAEVLNPGGEVEAVGRTPAVSGQLTASGSVIEQALIEADLTAIISDRPRRDGAIQRALGTGEYPTATFTSSAPIDLGEVPVEGEPFTASLPGSVTIRDVSQEVTLELTGQRVGDVVVVVGALPVDFVSFGVTMPTAPIVVSVEDAGDLEWQLFLRRSADVEGDTLDAAETAEDGEVDDATVEPSGEDAASEG